jgi:hypothetical protein
VVIPKSANHRRIFEDADIFDFEITAEDMQRLDHFNENLRTCWDPSHAPWAGTCRDAKDSLDAYSMFPEFLKHGSLSVRRNVASKNTRADFLRWESSPWEQNADRKRFELLERREQF